MFNKNRVAGSYGFAFLVCLVGIALGQLPYFFFRSKDAAWYQGLYFIAMFFISLVMTFFLGLVRLSYDDFNKSSIAYCLAGILTVAFPAFALCFLYVEGMTTLNLFLTFVLLVGILINRDILIQLKKPGSTP